ncbi:serine protease 33-like [Babylonia areolata]|uniref:serine protease 33-like n=1 Tax=Babylonia areolata TaxID=304850 RepID=UPI003FCF50FC
MEKFHQRKKRTHRQRTTSTLLLMTATLAAAAVLTNVPGVDAGTGSSSSSSSSSSSGGGGGGVVSQLYNKYGNGAGYIVFHFFLLLGNSQALERRLQDMQASGQLFSLCQYIPRDPSVCVRTTSSQDLPETVIIVTYLNTACCQPGTAVNGSWGSWGSWGSCSVSCGDGTRTRTRACDRPPPSRGGQQCVGAGSESSHCRLPACASHRTDCGAYKPRGKIVGGQQSVPGRYPWIAMLLHNGELQCGCVVVDHYHVLTAAHCLRGEVLNNQLNSNSFEVLAGQFRRSFDETLDHGAQRRFVVSGLRHPDFNTKYYLNDIAVLRLSSPLEFHSNVSQVCLPSARDVPPSRCTVAGWGALAYFQGVPEALMEVDLMTYNHTQCEAVFQRTTPIYNISSYLSPGVLCAANGTSGGMDSCRGDSGSGLMCVQSDSSGGGLYYALFGLVSSGFGCGERGEPAFYAYIPYYLSWIRTAISSLQGATRAAWGG